MVEQNQGTAVDVAFLVYAGYSHVSCSRLQTLGHVPSSPQDLVTEQLRCDLVDLGEPARIASTQLVLVLQFLGSHVRAKTQCKMCPRRRPPRPQ